MQVFCFQHLHDLSSPIHLQRHARCTLVEEPSCSVMVSCTSPSWVPTSPLMLQNTGLMYTAQNHHTCTAKDAGLSLPFSQPQTRPCVTAVASPPHQEAFQRS